MDKNQIDELIKNKDNGEKINSFIDKNLSAEQKTKLNDVLSDKEKLRDLLNSDKAKQIISRLKKE